MFRRCLKYAIALIGLAFLTAGLVSAQTVEEMQRRYLESTSTTAGKAYESIALAELTDDLRFLPDCAREQKVRSGAVTLFFDISPSGKVAEVFLLPQTVLNDCVHEALQTRQFSPPPARWTGRITLTIQR